MPNKCPLCGQVLPAAIDEQALHEKLDRLKAAAVKSVKEAARKELEQAFKERLREAKEDFEGKLIAAREVTRQQVEKEFRKELRESKEELDKYKQNLQHEVEKARRLGASEAERLMRAQLDTLSRRLREAEKSRAMAVARAKKEAAEEAREKEQLKHTVEMSRLQNKVDELNRQLEKKSGEQFGEEGELDLFDELRREFPTDRIERVGRCVKGADILHTVMDGNKVAGCIVYESKNVSAWQNAFIAQAKRYRTHYETPYVIVVSRAFPKKQRAMCAVDDVLIVEPRLAATLAAVMREGILEIGKLRLAKVGTDGKAQELFAYVVGNEFQTRFRDVADAVDVLKNIQEAERTWHANHWTKESRLHAQLQSRHREINAKLHLIVKEGDARRPMAVASEARFALSPALS
jgi:hypothetical protein